MSFKFPHGQSCLQNHLRAQPQISKTPTLTLSSNSFWQITAPLPVAKKSLCLLNVPCHPICVTLVSWGGSSRGPISTGGWGWLTCARGLGGLAGAPTAPGPAEDGPGASDGSIGSILSLPPAGAPLTVTRVVTPTVEPTSHDTIFSIESLGLFCQKVNM